MPESLISFFSHFLVRWTLMNMVGWSLGFFLGGLLLNAFGGVLGVILGGAVVGMLVGGAQWLVLQSETDRVDIRWVLLSGLGGALATLPAYLAGVTLVAGPAIGYFVIGALYGGIFGMLQWVILRTPYDELAMLWIIANVIGGGLCGCLTMTVNPLRLPLFCSVGPIAFGLITGYTLLYLQRQT